MKKTLYKLVVQDWKKMRYPTTGDYYQTKDGWEIVVAGNGNRDYDFLTLVHELIELYLTDRKGIREPDIMKFDVWFKKQKYKGLFKKYPEPGVHPKAPYRREHALAMKIEKMIARELKVKWKEYDDRITQIGEKIDKKFSAKSGSAFGGKNDGSAAKPKN